MPTLYYDPGLWDVLADRVAEEIATRRDHICDGRWKSLDDAREQIGFLRGLTWVLEAAAELRTNPTETDDE